MKRKNLFAASLVAGVLIGLSLLPLTKGALRFDMQLAAGRPVVGNLLTDLGLKQSDLPLNGLGPQLRTPPLPRRSGSSELPVRLADALALPGKDKWQALQALVAENPDYLPAHAALTRMACKNGGSVGVGHLEEQEALSPNPSPRGHTTPVTPPEGDPEDARILLRSCAVGERLDPENAYFPAMAAIGHYALGQDREAQTALARAATRPRWREYIEVEAQGRVRRAELLSGPQNSLTRSASYASILFPHYAALRAMARVATAQALQAEQVGAVAQGQALRKQVAQLGATMREQSSSLIGSLVGSAIVRVAEGRPGGAPALPIEDETGRKRLDTAFLSYLRTHGVRSEQVAWWERQLTATEQSRRIVQHTELSVFGSTTLFETQWRLLTSVALLGAVVLLSTLAGLALLQPWLGRRLGHVAPACAVALFFGLVLWGGWLALGNFRDLLAYSGLIQGLASEGTSPTEVAHQAASQQAIQGEMGLLAATVVSPLIYLGVVAFPPKGGKRYSITGRIAKSALPVAALLTLVYAGHLIAHSLRERVVEAELSQVLTHEGRYIAQKLGQRWPEVK